MHVFFKHVHVSCVLLSLQVQWPRQHVQHQQRQMLLHYQGHQRRSLPPVSLMFYDAHLSLSRPCLSYLCKLKPPLQFPKFQSQTFFLFFLLAFVVMAQSLFVHLSIIRSTSNTTCSNFLMIHLPNNRSSMVMFS